MGKLVINCKHVSSVEPRKVTVEEVSQILKEVSRALASARALTHTLYYYTSYYTTF